MRSELGPDDAAVRGTSLQMHKRGAQQQFNPNEGGKYKVAFLFKECCSAPKFEMFRDL